MGIHYKSRFFRLCVSLYLFLYYYFYHFLFLNIIRYERRREAERKGVMRVPEEQRKVILMENGTSEESLEEEARSLNKINWGRLESMASPTENPLPVKYY